VLVIRDMQVQALGDAIRSQFEGRLQNHLIEAFPRQCEFLGSTQVREIIKLGVLRASRFGFNSEADVFLYLCLMMMLGSFFDEDPLLHWVPRYLNGPVRPGIAGDREKLLQLHAATMDYLDHIAGDENESLIRALIRFRDFDVNAFRKLPDTGLPQALCDICSSLYPQKAAFAGTSSITTSFQRAVADARSHGLLTAYGQGIYAATAFMLGLGFKTDPQFIWANHALIHPVSGNGEMAATQLNAEARKYLAFGLTGG
jgi:hypothetical protein